MLAANEIPALDSADVLAKAARNAAAHLGLTRAELGEIIGRDRTSLNRGIRPDSKSGELALLFLRCYRGLYALLGGDRENMAHWFNTENIHLHGKPKDLVRNVEGLVAVLRYLDGMRGKI